jgi:hypothetical protein
MLARPPCAIPCRRERVVTVFATRASTTVIRFGRYGGKHALSRTSQGLSVVCGISHYRPCLGGNALHSSPRIHIWTAAAERKNPVFRPTFCCVFEG